MLTLVSIMMVAGAQLITHSVRLLGPPGPPVLDPVMVHVDERIRRDVQEAAELTTVESIWSEESLEIRTRTDSIVRYSVVDGSLVREELSAAGGRSTSGSFCAV